MASETARIVVELKPDGEDMSGWMTGPEGERRPFCGWLELASAFANLAAAAREADGRRETKRTGTDRYGGSERG